MNHLALQLARQMTGIEILPGSLCRRLEEVDLLARKVGGEISSRQVVAMIVADWQRSPEGAGFLLGKKA